MYTMKFFILIICLFTVDSFEPVICINCKHFTKDFFNSNTYGKCKMFPRETNSNYYLVDGKSNPQIDYFYCSTSRYSEDMCGKKGQFFVKKTK